MIVVKSVFAAKSKVSEVRYNGSMGISRILWYSMIQQL